MDVNTCPVCFTVMSSTQEPHILPSCGHTICIVCLNKILRDARECPLCRKRFEKTDLDHFPKNYQIISSLHESLKRSCAFHRAPLDLVCLDCKSEICNKCFLKGSHSGHSIDLLTDFLKEVNEKTTEVSLWSQKISEHSKKRENFCQDIKKNLITKVKDRFDGLSELIKSEMKIAIKTVETTFERVVGEI